VAPSGRAQNSLQILTSSRLQAITPHSFLHDGNLTTAGSFCTTDLNENVTISYGVFAEAFATGVLVLFACGVWDPRNKNSSDAVPIKFGLCITALCLVFAPYTGCSLNPARSFGPAVWNVYWRNHWIYWIGPITGSAMAAFIYRWVFLPRTSRRDTPVENLNGIET